MAGDKAAARVLAVAEVSGAVVRAILHNDRAHFVDTLRALPKGATAHAIAVTFAAIEQHCVTLHASGAAYPVAEGSEPWAVEFAAHVHRIATEYAAPLAEVRAAEPKARKVMESTLAEMGKETARVWLASVDALCEAASVARKAKADERKAAKAAEAEAAEAAKAEAERVRLAGVQGQAIGADGQAIGTNVSAMIDEVNTAMAAAEAATRRAELAEAARDAAKAEAAALRAELAEARELIAGLQAAAEAAKAAAEAAPKASRKGRKVAEAA